MAQVKIGDPHGLDRVLIGLVDENGYNYGTAGTGVGNGTLITPYLMKYPKTAAMQMPSRTVIDFTGGNVWTGSFMYGITSLGSYQLESATVEADLIALVSGALVDQTTNTQWTIYAENILLPTPPQVFMISTFNLQSKETGSIGAAKYIHAITPRAWVAPKGINGAPAFQASGTYAFDVVPTAGDRMPWGPAFGADQGWANYQSPLFFMITDNPIHIVGYKASTTSATITLPYKPIVVDYTSPDSQTQPIQVAVNGVITDAHAISSGAGTVNVTGVVAGNYIGILYETNYVINS